MGIADGFEVGTGDGTSLGGVVGTAVVGSADGAGLGGVVGTGLGTEVGTGVEMKKATLGEGAKASHLTYLGDTEVGAGANIGAGTITCNYDGYFKYRTVIGERAFIGSNSALVAPVTIGADAIVAAGSTVTRDVAAGELRMERAEQSIKPGWADRFHDTMKKKKAGEKR